MNKSVLLGAVMALGMAATTSGASTLEEVKARGGTLYVFGNAKSEIEIKKGKFIRMPLCGDYNAPIIYTIPLQLLAYEVACLRGTDLDQPRNLAKSVTVE